MYSVEEYLILKDNKWNPLDSYFCTKMHFA